LKFKFVINKFGLIEGLKLRGQFEVWCYNKHGNLKWYEKSHNLCVDEGLDYLLDVFLGSETKPTWYCALRDDANTPASDWTASGNGTQYTEFTGYDEGSRPTYQAGSASNKSIDNEANKATYTINTSGTLTGAYLVTSPNKGTGEGIMYCCSNFSSSRSVEPGDTVQLKYTCTSADDGE